MDIRKKNAQYDTEIGHIYDKCAWCGGIILSNRYVLNNGQVGFCSEHCRNVGKWALRQHGIRNKKTDEDSYMYELLQVAVTNNYERVKRRRGY